MRCFSVFCWRNEAGMRDFGLRRWMLRSSGARGGQRRRIRRRGRGPCRDRSGASNMAHRLLTDLKRNRAVRRFGGCFENACHDHQHLPLESQVRRSLFRLAIFASKIEAQRQIQASGVSVPQQQSVLSRGPDIPSCWAPHRGWLSQLKRPQLYP